MSDINQPSKPVIIAPSNIDSNERDYYTSKLYNHTKKLHGILISSFIISIIDFMVIGISKFLFGNFLNKLSIFSLFVWSIICLYIYRYSYKTLDSIDVSQLFKDNQITGLKFEIVYMVEDFHSPEAPDTAVAEDCESLKEAVSTEKIKASEVTIDVQKGILKMTFEILFEEYNNDQAGVSK